MDEFSILNAQVLLSPDAAQVLDVIYSKEDTATSLKANLVGRKDLSSSLVQEERLDVSGKSSGELPVRTGLRFALDAFLNCGQNTCPLSYLKSNKQI